MLPLSDKFKKALKYSHRITSYLTVHNAFSNSVIWDSRTVNPGALLDGDVNVASAVVRRRVSCSLVDSTGTLTPRVAYDIFTCYGNEIRPYRGIAFTDGTYEDVPLGVFEITDVNVEDSGAGVSISLSGFDRAHTVATRKPIQDLVVQEGLYYTDVIQQLLLIACPQLTFNFFTLPYACPALVIKTGEDIWAKCTAMSAAIGCMLYFDPMGVCTLKSVHAPVVSDICWTYAEGAEATILSANKRLTNTNAFNYYIYTGENSANTVPVRGDAYDDNPASPTYWRGPYGTRPAPVVSSKLITTADQAQAAARADLQNTIGYSEQIHFNALVNPAHDVGDIVQVVRGKTGINNLYLCDQFSVPLSHNRAMDVVTRVRQATV